MRPNEFYLGVIDFFAVLVPGSISSAVLVLGFAGEKTASISNLQKTLFDNWFIFLVGAYFIGHLFFLVGSYLDEWAYDPLREWLLKKEDKLNRSDTIKKLHRLLNKLLPKVQVNEKAYQCAKAICFSFFKPDDQDAVKVLQWARSVLLITCPEAAEEVRRLEADSKFFRSLIVVCLLAPLFLCKLSIAASYISLLLALPCFIRYFERRLKAMTQTCIHIITLRQLSKLPKPDSAS